MKNKKGFTLIEVLIIVTIIALLAMVVLASADQGRKNSRISVAKTSLRTILPVIIACVDSGGAVVPPGNPETGIKAICNPNNVFSNAFWPQLSGGYLYVLGGDYSIDCNFQVSTNNDKTPLGNMFLTCNCKAQMCQ